MLRNDRDAASRRKAGQCCRWILPFSRQFTITAMTYVPLVPWRLKMALVRFYLRRCFYGPAGLIHAAPAGAVAAMDYTGMPSCHQLACASLECNSANPCARRGNQASATMPYSSSAERAWHRSWWMA